MWKSATEKYYNLAKSSHCWDVKTMNPPLTVTSSRSCAHALHKFKFSEVYSWFLKLQGCRNRPPNPMGLVRGSMLRQKYYNVANSRLCWDVKPMNPLFMVSCSRNGASALPKIKFSEVYSWFLNLQRVQTGFQTILDLYVEECYGRNIIIWQIQVTVETWKPWIHRWQLLHPIAAHMLYIISSFQRCIHGF
jgi:hypothetical protein